MYSVFALAEVVFFLLLPFTSSTSLRWHLPWPVLQWALTTLVGNLILCALYLLVAGPAFILFGVWRCRRMVARARDVTGMPLAAGTNSQARLHLPLLQRWLGVDRRERALSLVLLAFGVLLVVALVGIACASSVSVFSGSVWNGLCSDQYGCPPNVVALAWTSMASIWAAAALMFGVRFIWLRRVEATSGVVFLYAESVRMKSLCYVRQPGVTSEAASLALARVSSNRTIPLARQLFFGVLVMSLALVPCWAGMILNSWLPGQWLPG
jgi:hypothetical protein